MKKGIYTVNRRDEVMDALDGHYQIEFLAPLPKDRGPSPLSETDSEGRVHYKLKDKKLFEYSRLLDLTIKLGFRRQLRRSSALDYQDIHRESGDAELNKTARLISPP